MTFEAGLYEEIATGVRLCYNPSRGSNSMYRAHVVLSWSPAPYYDTVLVAVEDFAECWRRVGPLPGGE